MERFVIVLFRLIEPGRGAQVRETGGGVVFIPEPRPEDWQSRAGRLVEKHFKHELGPCVEVGYATLDVSLVQRHCQEHEGLYWQGGDA